MLDGHLMSIANSFNELLRDCAQGLRPRQRVLTRQEHGYILVEIRSSFKIPLAPPSLDLDGAHDGK